MQTVKRSHLRRLPFSVQDTLFRILLETEPHPVVPQGSCGSTSGVSLGLTADPPVPSDPTAASPETFTGSMIGGDISASLFVFGGAGGMACPGNSVAPAVGGALTATVSNGRIVGDFTQTYGAGAAQVTFGFHFQAAFPSSQ